MALDRQTRDARFPVIPVLMPGCDSPPTGFLKLLTWVDLRQSAGVLEQVPRLADLRAALQGEKVVDSGVRASICPYRGLEPFREEDAAFFCGRDNGIRELVVRVQAHNFVAVVGPSGTGKSSLVFAGLLPALREQRSTTMWDAVTLRPGRSPLTALAEAFGVGPHGAGPAAIDTYLEKEVAAYRVGDADKLARIVGRRLDSAPEKPDRLLIYVDQWEELYAMAPAPEDTERAKQHSADVERFVELMVATASNAGSRTTLVITVRADFYNPLVRNQRLAAFLPKQQVNIPPMGRDDLRAAIETPAKTAGLTFAPVQLVDRILDDVGLEEGRLPLLQFALKETWQRRQGGRLTAEAYTEVGGVAGAIEKTAEDAYQQLTPLQRDAARRLFLRLVTPGEGQADTRARSVIPDDPEQRDIVRLFANPKTRLLVTGYDNTQGSASAGGEPRSTVELAHEALIQRWPTLRDWVRINRDNMRARATVLRGKAEWEEHGEDEKFLLNPGVQLERGRALLQQPGDVAVDDIVYYVVHSIEKDDRRLAAERETALADQKRIADARKRTAQVAVIGLVAALLVAGAALWQYLNATEATKVAKDATARAQASTEQAKTNLHEAKLAEEAADKAKKDALAQRDRAVQAEERARASAEQAQANLNVAQVAQSRFLSDLARERRAAPGGAGTAILLALEALPDITNHLARPYVPEAKLQLDAAWRDLRERVILSGQGADVTRAAFSPDDKRVVTASGDGTARIWDAATGQPVGEVLRGHSGPVVSAAFSPDGKRIVTASMDMTARIWDAATSHQIGEPLAGHKDAVRSAMFSPDGARVVTASWDGTARVWNAATGQPIGQPLMGHQFGLRSAAFSPDGTRIVTAGDDKTARIWDASTDQQIGVWLIGHGAQVVAASFSPDGKRIVTASWDKTARVWDAATGQQIGEPLIVGNELMSAGFSPNGNRIITASVDSMVRLWDTGNGQPIGEPLSGHLSQVNSAAFSPDGSRIVTASNDLTVRIWDAVTGRQVGRPLGGDTSAAFSPDGQRIVTASADKTARVWDAATGQLTEVLLGHQGAVRSAAFSPDGRRIVTASDDKTARVWDAASGHAFLELRGHQGPLSSAAFSPGGRCIVTASWDGTARLWDATGQAIRELSGHKGYLLGAMFSPDGQRIVTASEDRTARVWNDTCDAANTAALVSQAEVDIPRCLTRSQRTAFFLPPEPPAWCIGPYDTPEWKQWLAEQRAGKNMPLPAGP